MADPRSHLKWLQKELPNVEAAFAKVAHHAAGSTRRISAEKKLIGLRERIQQFEARVAREPILNPASPLNPADDATKSSLTNTDGLAPPGPGVANPNPGEDVDASAAESAAMDLEHNQDAASTVPGVANPNPGGEDVDASAAESAAMDLDHNQDAASTIPGVANPNPGKDAGLTTVKPAAMDVDNDQNPASTGSGVANPNPGETAVKPAAIDVDTDQNPASTDEKPAPETVNVPQGVGPNGPKQSVAAGPVATTAPAKLTNSHGFTRQQGAEISQMYPSELDNDYDIIEYVEPYINEDTLYAEYANKFAQYPALYSDAIPHKMLKAFSDVEDITVKAISHRLNRWDNLSSTDKIILSILGRVAIRKFVEANKGDRNATLGPNWVKVLARAEPRFLPEAATTSAPVALAFLRMQNLPEVRCRFHHSERHDERSIPDTTKRFTGCAFPPPEMREKKPKGKGKTSTAIPTPTRQEGHLDCGCAIVDALEDWFHYKTARLLSTNPRISTAFLVQGVIPTAERASLLFASRTPIYFPLQLRYTGVTGWPDLAGQWMSPTYELNLLRKCCAFIVGRIQHLENIPAPSSVPSGITDGADEPESQPENPENTAKVKQASEQLEGSEEASGQLKGSEASEELKKADDLPVADKRAHEVDDLIDSSGQTKKIKL